MDEIYLLIREFAQNGITQISYTFDGFTNDSTIQIAISQLRNDGYTIKFCEGPYNNRHHMSGTTFWIISW